MAKREISRRDFVRLSCCSAAGAALASGMGRFGLVNAYAQSSPQYRALVCIFLFGGNDGNNTVIPFSTAGYQQYATARTGMALAQNTLLPITAKTGNVPYAFHPQMAGLQSLFNSGQLALVANVGTLVKPITQAQYQAGASVPASLFSHSDQQAQWQTSIPNSSATSGWAGRAADKTQGLNVGAKLPTVLSVAGANIFTTGLVTRPAAVSPGNTSGFAGFSNSAGSVARYSTMQELLTFDSGVSLIQAASTITGYAFADSTALANALATGTPLKTTFPTTSLGSQLKQVAQILQVRGALSINRQIFFCSLGGFDTHSNQLADQSNLLGQLSAAMSAFYNAMVELNISSQVTTFTLSEFSRTLQESSGAGTDHAWGNHHLVMGGAVHGGDLYGTFPTLVLGGPDDTGTRGRWIPTTALDQYAATLASWFGVADADLQPYVFPDLANFAAMKLSFMG